MIVLRFTHAHSSAGRVLLELNMRLTPAKVVGLDAVFVFRKQA
jgi:hypothetical protein